MLERSENTASLYQAAQYGLMLCHCSVKLDVNEKRWYHANALTYAIDYARTSGQLNAKIELTLMNKSYFVHQNLDSNEAAQVGPTKKIVTAVGRRHHIAKGGTIVLKSRSKRKS